MALNNYGLGIVVTAKDLASAAIGKVGRSVTGLEAGLEQVGKRMEMVKRIVTGGLISIAAGTGGLFAANALANKFGEFETAVARVGAISQASAKDMKLLEEAAVSAGIRTKFTSVESANALADMAAMGFNARASVAALTPALDLAAGGAIGVADASMAMASALKVFSLDVSEAGSAADKLLKISNITALQARDLQLALGTVGRGAGLAKQSLDEMLISMGLVKNTGVDVSVAASSVSRALIELANKSDKFKKLGVDVADASGNFRPLIDVIMDTHEALSDVTDQTERTKQATALFGRFGINAFQAISSQITNGIEDTNGAILKGADAVNFLRRTMADAGGTAERMREQMLASFGEQKKLLEGVGQTALIEIGRPFAEVLRPVVLGVVEALTRFTELMRALPASVKRIGAVVFLATSLFLILGGAIAIVTAAAFALAPILPVIGALLLKALVVVAPIILALGALAAVVGLVGIAIRENFGGLGDMMERQFKRASLAFRSIVAFLTEGKLSGELAEEFMGADQGLQDFVVRGVLFFEKLKAGWDGFVQGIKDAVDFSVPIINVLLAEFQKLGEQLGLNIDFTSGASTAAEKFAAVGKIMAGIVVGIADAFAIVLAIVMRVIRVVVSFIQLIWKALKIMAKLATFSLPTMDDFKDMFGSGGDFLDSIFGFADKEMTPDVLSLDNPAKIQARMRAQRAKRLQDIQNSAGPMSEGPAVAAAEVAMSMEGGMSQADISNLAEATARAVSKQPINAQISMSLDGDVLYSSMERLNRDDAVGGFSSAVPEG